MHDEQQRERPLRSAWAALGEVPSLRHASHYPLTASVGLASILATVIWWCGGKGPWATMSSLAFGAQPWRFLSCMLVHADLPHLGFNLYWLWYFSARLERMLGALRLGALMLLLAITSSAAEYAFFVGGVGLSGLGYGLFAFAWTLSRRDSRFAPLVPNPVVILLVGWFVLCIAVTVLRWWPIANVSHAAGAALGALLGLARTPARRARWGYGLAAALCSLALLCAATVGRPFVNLRAGDVIETTPPESNEATPFTER